MQTMQFISQIGQDGLLQLPLPDTWKGTEVEVLVVLQPVSKPDKNLVDSLAMPNDQVSRTSKALLLENQNQKQNFAH